MIKFVAILLAAALCAVPTWSGAAAPKLPELEAQVHCALVFGKVVREQSQKVPRSERFPAMAGPGREFFVITGARALDEKAVTLETIEAYYMSRFAVLQDSLTKAADPAAPN
jgi:hypothetical protein